MEKVDIENKIENNQILSSEAIDISETLSDKEVLEDIKGWNWGAFLLNWVWGLNNRTYIALLALIPYLGIIVMIYLGIKGNELAWKNKDWASVEDFKRVQKKWKMWGFIVLAVGLILGLALNSVGIEL